MFSRDTVATENVVIGTKIQVVVKPLTTIGQIMLAGAIWVVRPPNMYIDNPKTANPPPIQARPSILGFARILPEMILPKIAPIPRGLSTRPACKEV
jgi:hypothetical protein